MIHCIVSYIQIDTNGSCGHAPLVVILYVLSEVYNVLHDFHGLKTCLFLDEVFFNNWNYELSKIYDIMASDVQHTQFIHIYMDFL